MERRQNFHYEIPERPSHSYPGLHDSHMYGHQNEQYWNREYHSQRHGLSDSEIMAILLQLKQEIDRQPTEMQEEYKENC